jgi:CheY-like chemotaxis protein
MSAKKPRQIFIVDDNEIYSMMLDYILSKNNIYKFVNFKSGEECIKNLYLNPEIIILDYEMPGLNGYETLVEIKKQNPHIHVIILTSHEDEELKQKLLLAGADDHVLKQHHGEKQLIEKIEKILSKEEFEASNAWGMKNKMVYFILTVILLTLVFFYYKMHS